MYPYFCKYFLCFKTRLLRHKLQYISLEYRYLFIRKQKGLSSLTSLNYRNSSSRSISRYGICYGSFPKLNLCELPSPHQKLPTRISQNNLSKQPLTARIDFICPWHPATNLFQQNALLKQMT